MSVSPPLFLRLRAFDVPVTFAFIALTLYLYSVKDEHVFFPHPQQNLTDGIPHLIDGDSIVLNGIEMRLIGIDAPELHQSCQKKGENYRCGVAAKNHLEHLINGEAIRCRWNEIDLYERALALCTKGKVLINRQMVLDGYAVNFYDYPQEEKLARRERRGIWQSTFKRPKDWRRDHPWK